MEARRARPTPLLGVSVWIVALATLIVDVWVGVNAASVGDVNPAHSETTMAVVDNAEPVNVIVVDSDDPATFHHIRRFF